MGSSSTQVEEAPLRSQGGYCAAGEDGVEWSDGLTSVRILLSCYQPTAFCVSSFLR
jgi:hypothetical protein